MSKYDQLEDCCLQLVFSGAGDDCLLNAIESLKCEYVMREARAMKLTIKGVSNRVQKKQRMKALHIHGLADELFDLLANSVGDNIFLCGDVHVSTAEDLKKFSTLPHALLVSSDEENEITETSKGRKTAKLGAAKMEYATTRIELPVDSGMYASGLSVIGTLIGVSTTAGVLMVGRRLEDGKDVVEILFMFEPNERKNFERLVDRFEIALTWNIPRKQILPLSGWSTTPSDFMAVEQIETITNFCHSAVAELQAQ